ncbi:MAG: L-2-amino-thiazoline-4-carboxylic acid hydrolase [Phycisphaerae bacterium]|nr:L-2-amino-thiazoline-4-carboxylic acid hydrolase [Phycisphaerae bacterium]
MRPVTRREFIACSVAGSCSFLPRCPFLAPAACAAEPVARDNYYLAHKKELTDAFRGFIAGARQFLSPELGVGLAETVAEQALRGFDRLLPRLPEVGGERNWDTQYLPIAAWYVALYEPLRANGKKAEDVGRVVYELNRIELEGMPKDKARSQGDALFTRESLDKMRAWVVWTQKREYPANWVATFVPGDGKDFDFGYDYSECALCKYFRSQGVPELAPYVCLNDFVRSRVLGTGLRRTMTLAQGDLVCNFRYKKAGPVLQDWSTEIGLIRSRMGTKPARRT